MVQKQCVITRMSGMLLMMSVTSYLDGVTGLQTFKKLMNSSTDQNVRYRIEKAAEFLGMTFGVVAAMSSFKLRRNKKSS